ncbi:pentapeptide repeat-containing protein [Clostridium sp. SHJSY1]|uniref:pentapeptide repeat-containing protein n=1 Tax=Clostridium sp. SHJSY1 TaxID=2942483 RepID=UPI002874B02F|nr:pentapeptide repeat-containing protein [Clostridium sp. SHJSY1]MDS0526507.1 pentapeptide repeat-containing protein [Clostridium sp. SHJSY1]
MGRNQSTGTFNYNNVQKKEKNFMYDNLKRSNCYNCDFDTCNFDFVSFRGAHFKKCSFYSSSFKGAEFVGANLKGSKFKKSVFENTIFDSVNLDGVDFRDAEFKNVIFLESDLSKAINIDIENPEIRVFNEVPEVEISEALKNAVDELNENEYIKNARIFDTKDGSINLLTMMILLENFEEDRLIKGLNTIKVEIKRDFHTLSYIIRLIEKVN